MLGYFKIWGLRSNEITDIFLGFKHLKDQQHNILKLVITEALKYKNFKDQHHKPMLKIYYYKTIEVYYQIALHNYDSSIMIVIGPIRRREERM